MLYKVSRQEICDYGATIFGSILNKFNSSTSLKNDLQNKIIQAYDSKDKSFDGTKLQGLLFPQIDSSSVFISHSFGDQKIAIKLKIIIERELGFKAFVDSLY